MTIEPGATRTMAQPASPPIVSLAGMRSADPAERASVAAAFRAACVDTGFLYIVDHGIPAALTDAVFAETKRFFDLPMERKLAVDKATSPCNRGYEPLRGQTLQKGAPPDLKEG